MLRGLPGAVCTFLWTPSEPQAPAQDSESLYSSGPTPGRGGWSGGFNSPLCLDALFGANVALADEVQPVAPRAPIQEKRTAGTGEQEGFHLLDLETRKRTFFKYEKRIRSLSTPEKIFEYFASIEDDGVKSMSHQDLLRALTAVYPPEDSSQERAGALLGATTSLLFFFHDLACWQVVSFFQVGWIEDEKLQCKMQTQVTFALRLLLNCPGCEIAHRRKGPE